MVTRDKKQHKLLSKIKFENLRQLLQEFLWLEQYSRQNKPAIAWYMFVGLLGIAASLAVAV